MKKAFRFFLIVIVFMIVVLGICYMLSGGKSEIVNRVVIRNSPSTIFNYISDMRNELKWNPDVLYMNKISDGEIGQGTTFRAKWHMSDTLNVTITKYEPPHEITFENGGPVEVVLRVTLTPKDSSTELESRFIATPHGFIRAIFPIFKYGIEKQEKENMQNLKRVLDQVD